jgi:hypothetical protein
MKQLPWRIQIHLVVARPRTDVPQLTQVGGLPLGFGEFGGTVGRRVVPPGVQVRELVGPVEHVGDQPLEGEARRRTDLVAEASPR